MRRSACSPWCGWGRSSTTRPPSSATADGSTASRGISLAIGAVQYRVHPMAAGVARQPRRSAYSAQCEQCGDPAQRQLACGGGLDQRGAGATGALFFVDGTVIGPQNATYSSPATGAATWPNVIWQTDTTSADIRPVRLEPGALRARISRAIYNAIKASTAGAAVRRRPDASGSGHPLQSEARPHPEVPGESRASKDAEAERGPLGATHRKGSFP